MPPASDVDPIPARMLNEFVYCSRLFYYEHVEGVFLENADTLRGSAIHKKVDSGNGAMPVAPGRAGASPAGSGALAGTSSADPSTSEKEAEPEVIHSRSVSMGSDRLGVVAKMDLVESRTDSSDLLTATEVCPVDYKAGAPKEATSREEAKRESGPQRSQESSEQGLQLWDTDKMQLGLQALILRDNGYNCTEGVIYYRATKQRVRLAVTAELESWIVSRIAEARQTMTGPIPPPLVNSPKCVRCSLAPICLPDETRMLASQSTVGEGKGLSGLDDASSRLQDPSSGATSESRARSEEEGAPRRLIASCDDRRPLYLNTPGLRVGCTQEVLQVKEKDKVVQEVRLRDVSHVALFGNIQISTQAIQSLCELEVPVTYFSMGGWFYGITRGHGLKNVLLRMEQFRQAGEERICVELARRFVHGKIRNHRTLLMRNHLQPPEGTIVRLKRAAEDVLEAKTLEELLGMEGAAASEYFQQFGGMIKVADELEEVSDSSKGCLAGSKQLAFNFSFVNRNRRPPNDPVNALLSLAYSMLSKDCVLAALAVGLDPYVGFYHQPRPGRPALALDLMEEFRPLVAESTVLNAINSRVVTAGDFIRAGDAVNLTANGRKRFSRLTNSG